MARLMRQSREIKELFRKKILEKVSREKQNIQQKVSEEFPSWLTWATKSIAGIAFDMKHNRDCEKGDSGEGKAILGFWTLLPNDWIMINDVVLEPSPGDFIQIDHVLLGPPGIFLIETKAWEGAFKGYKDQWKRKQGNIWVPCNSPTQQNKWHVRLFKKWIEDNDSCISQCEIEQVLFPIVLFTKARWLKVQECSMPVFDSVIALSLYIRSKTKNNVLSYEQINKIAEAIINAKPFELTNFQQEDSKVSSQTKQNNPKIQVQMGRTKNGRSYVKILGSKEDAQKIWEKYEDKKPSELKADKYSTNAWYFYVED